MSKHWKHREPVTALEAALQFANLFALEAKRVGDMLNYYRWRCVASDIQKLTPDPRQLDWVN